MRDIPCGALASWPFYGMWPSSAYNSKLFVDEMNSTTEVTRYLVGPTTRTITAASNDEDSRRYSNTTRTPIAPRSIVPRENRETLPLPPPPHTPPITGRQQEKHTKNSSLYSPSRLFAHLAVRFDPDGVTGWVGSKHSDGHQHAAPTETADQLDLERGDSQQLNLALVSRRPRNTRASQWHTCQPHHYLLVNSAPRRVPRPMHREHNARWNATTSDNLPYRNSIALHALLGANFVSSMSYDLPRMRCSFFFWLSSLNFCSLTSFGELA